MKYYIQVIDGYITDCIDYQNGNYTEIDLVTVPTRFTSGIYKYTNGIIELDTIKEQELINYLIQLEQL